MDLAFCVNVNSTFLVNGNEEELVNRSNLQGLWIKGESIQKIRHRWKRVNFGKVAGWSFTSNTLVRVMKLKTFVKPLHLDLRSLQKNQQSSIIE